MALSPIVVSVPMYISGIALERWLDRRRDAGMYRFNDALSNLGTGVMQTVVGALFAAALSAPYHWLYAHARLTDWFSAHPTASWLFAFVASDFFYYWFHRWSHECALGWFSHVVHHQSEDYNLSVALRQDAWQPFFSLWFMLPVAVMGVDPHTFASAYGFMIVYQYWIHTRFIGTLGPLEWVLNTPSHHRVHHGVDPDYVDKNYAGALIIWDRLFGTFVAERQAPTYGVISPLASFNPIWAHVDYGITLARRVASMPGPVAALEALLRGPGWLPGGGAMDEAIRSGAAARQAQAKYEVPTTPATRGYVLAVFASALLAAGPVIVRWTRFGEGAVLVAFALWSLGNVGGLTERRGWAPTSERARLIFQAAGGVALALGTGDARWLALSAAALALRVGLPRALA
jgi:sterol desaturase/sphingolipid hydroxylase (fatty acid hydroxylase superfamily)